jgi:predicted nucleic acid-binding protein
MKKIVFDAGPVISLTTNNLLWILRDLKRKFDVDFLIPKSVADELVQRPLQTKKFKFEALQVQRLIDDGVFRVIETKETHKKALGLLDTANRVFKAGRQPLRIVQMGEMEALAIYKMLNADGMVLDERITRTLIEAPHALETLYERRLHTNVELDEKALREFSSEFKDVKIIRSIELAMIAFENGLMDHYLVNIPYARKELLDSVLWGIKLHGASVTNDEIKELVKIGTAKKR